MNKLEPTLQPIFAHDIAPGEPLKVSDLDFYNLFRRQADESHLFFNQRRAVIFDTEAMGTLRQQMIESLGIELAMGVLTRFGYTHGYNDAEMLAKKFNWASDMDWLAAGPTLHMLEGIVHVEPQKIEFNRETGHFYMHGIWLNSYEAEQHLRCFNVSDQPVCWTLTGYASGYATRFLGRDMLAIETECVGKGDARCYWEIRPVQRWGAEAEPYLKALEKIDVSSQLVETNHQLEEQIAENAHLFQQAETALAEQGRLLAELENQRAMLQAVLQSIPAGVFVAEAPTGKPLLSNKYAEEILGKGISPEASVEELAQVYSAYRYGSDELYPTNEMPLVRGMFGEITSVNDMEIRQPDGSHITLQVFGAPVYDPSGQVVSSVAIFQDITERNLAEEALRKSQITYQALLNSVPDLIIRLHRDGTYLDIKPAKDFDPPVSPGQFLGKKVSELLPKKLAQQRMRAVEQALQTGEMQVSKQEVTRNNEVRYEEVRVVASGSDEVLIIIRDITERKYTEQTIAKRASELAVVAQVSTAVATILETDELLQKVVNLTRSGFSLYHAHIYLLNKAGNTLELKAGAGEVGQQMVAKGWSISLDREHSLVARAARSRQAVIVNDVRQTPSFLPNPLLPETRSEMAIPLIIEENLLGVLDVQADVINWFTEEDIRIETALAGQIAVALENARPFEQTQARARREQILREVTGRVRSSIDADTIMRTAVQEVGRALGRPAFIYLGIEEKQPNHESDI